jgi:hypothetical protein
LRRKWGWNKGIWKPGFGQGHAEGLSRIPAPHPVFWQEKRGDFSKAAALHSAERRPFRVSVRIVNVSEALSRRKNGAFLPFFFLFS